MDMTCVEWCMQEVCNTTISAIPGLVLQSRQNYQWHDIWPASEMIHTSENVSVCLTKRPRSNKINVNVVEACFGLVCWGMHRCVYTPLTLGSRGRIKTSQRCYSSWWPEDCSHSVFHWSWGSRVQQIKQSFKNSLTMALWDEGMRKIRWYISHDLLGRMWHWQVFEFACHNFRRRYCEWVQRR